MQHCDKQNIKNIESLLRSDKMKELAINNGVTLSVNTSYHTTDYATTYLIVEPINPESNIANFMMDIKSSLVDKIGIPISYRYNSPTVRSLVISYNADSLSKIKGEQVKKRDEQGDFDSIAVKEGVAELFESNTELANSVYEALGFNNLITPNDKIVFGHPTIGKTFLKEKGITNFISFDDDFAEEINNFVNTHKGSLDKYQYKQSKPKEYIDFSLSLYDKAKAQAKKESKILFTSSNIIFENRINDFDKVINLEREEFFKRIRERKTTYDIVAWKDQIDNLISKVDSNKVINTRLYLSDLLKNAIIKPTDKIIWGHPAIGKSYAAKKVKMIDFDSYKLGINKKYNLYIAPGLSDTELRTDDKTREARENWRYESEENQALWNQFIRDVWQQAKKDAKEQGAILFASDLLVLREFGNEVDKALTMPDELFFERSKQRNNFIEGELGTKVWKGNLNRAVNNFKEKFGEDKVISTEKYLSDLFITPQQKQQALQLYSQYLDTIFPDSKVKEIVYRGTPENYPIKKGISPSLGEGITFTSDKEWARSYTENGSAPTLHTVLINIKNPIVLEDNIDKLSENKQNAYIKQRNNKVNDGVISLNEYLVIEPEQIHILGSKKDIEGFKEFVSNNSKKEIINQEVKEGVQELFDSNPELASQIYEAAGFTEKTDYKKEKDIFYQDVKSKYNFESTDSLLKSISNNTKNPNYKRLADTFLKIKELKEVNLIENNNLSVNGNYILSTNSININIDRIIKRSNIKGYNAEFMLEQTILHEIVHALTKKATTSLERNEFIRNIENLAYKLYNEEIKDSKSDFKKYLEIQQEIKSNRENVSEEDYEFVADRQFKFYGLTNLDEFLTMSMTNPDFRNKLKETTLWQELKHLIAKFLGIAKTDLDFLESNFDRFLESTYSVNLEAQITSQQKQQAQQLYSRYLESLNKPNTNPILQGNQTNVEEIITQLEKDGLLEIDCKGKIKAEKGLQTNFVKGGKWKLIKDLKGYPTHKEGGVDLTINKNGVSIKNGNTQFTAKHGLVIPKN